MESSRLARSGLDNIDLSALAAQYASETTIDGWTDDLSSASLETGSRLLLSCQSSVTHVALLFTLLNLGISPLLLAPGSSAVERDKYARQFDTRWHLTISPGGTLQLQHIGAEHEQSPMTKRRSVGIYLLTSGSTGEPTMIFRSLASWHNESLRYRTLLKLHRDHNVTIAAPLYHAYSLGWIWAAAQAGCRLQTLAPTQLAAITKSLKQSCTHCALTPFVASLLSRRAGTGARPHRLEVVMAGAGPVDSALEEQFQAAFGVGLSRNYGSTESGALFAGLAPQPPQSIGQPMPNIRVVSDNSSDPEFILDVELEDGSIYHTGDLVRQNEQNFYVVGRATTAIRRGERWISPFEIESVLLEHPTVDSCRVRAVASDRVGNDHILASVILHEGEIWDEQALHKFCLQRLDRGKVPDRFEQVGHIARGTNGKVLPSKIYRPASITSLAEAAHAYKRAHLLFALHSAGVLAQLDGNRSVDQIAMSCGINADALNQALELASMLGLVEEKASSAPSQPLIGADVTAMLGLECDTNKSWNSVELLQSVLRNGVFARPFDEALPSPQFAQLYQTAMKGSSKSMSRMLAIRKLLQIKASPLTSLDISATSGAYSHELKSRGLLNPLHSRYVKVGGLNDENPPPPEVIADRFSTMPVQSHTYDLIVLDNTIHHSTVARRLDALCDCLKPDGILLVDELFIEKDSALLGVDWFSHGGLHFPTRTSLDAAIQGHGFEALDIHHTNTTAGSHNLTIYTRK